MQTPAIGNSTHHKDAVRIDQLTVPASVPPAKAVAAAQPSAADSDLGPVIDAVHNINKTMQAMSQKLEFSIDTDSKRPIVKVVDQETNEVIRQMPTAEALEIAKALDRVRGLLIRQKA